MRWLKAGLLAVPAALFALALLMAGCGPTGSGDEDDYTPPKRQAGEGGGLKEDQLKPVVARNNEYMTITGTVSYEGPTLELARMTSEFLGRMGSDAYCKQGMLDGKLVSPLEELEKQQQEYRIGTNNKLGNVFVWIEPPSGTYFQLPEEQLKRFQGEKVLISQPHCVFLPHCSKLFPRYYKNGTYEPTGQVLLMENDAWVPHNAKFSGRVNQQNEAISPKTPPIQFTLMPEVDPIPINCNTHTWMRGYILARDHPYVAVSSVGADLTGAKKVYENPAAADFGKFELKDVPVGAKVRLRAWHESLRIFDKKTKGELKAGVDIEITPEMKTLELVAR